MARTSNALSGDASAPAAHGGGGMRASTAEEKKTGILRRVGENEEEAGIDAGLGTDDAGDEPPRSRLCIHACMHAHMHVYRQCVCVCVYVCVYICMFVCTVRIGRVRACVHARMQTYKHAL